jgi:3-dehydroquinate synthase
MDVVAVSLAQNNRCYEVIVADDWQGLGPFIRGCVDSPHAFVVADTNTLPLAGAVQSALLDAGHRVDSAVLPPGESQKTLSSAAILYDQLSDVGAGRDTLVVAVGGGVIGDLAGFVAATYMRGLPLLMVPTTLLAMVDSSVGGKVAVNHWRAKNLIGAFHQPIGVWANLIALVTLPDREFRCGLAEVVKYGVVLDAELFDYLESRAESILDREPSVLAHIVGRSCRLKADIVTRDERETAGARAILNYGHTFGHAFEQAAAYEGWRHGEAVAVGMACAARLAVQRGLLSRDVAERQQHLLERFGLPVVPEAWPLDGIVAAMRHDKKSLGSRLRLVLPDRLGHAALVGDVSDEEVRQALQVE